MKRVFAFVLMSLFVSAMVFGSEPETALPQKEHTQAEQPQTTQPEAEPLTVKPNPLPPEQTLSVAPSGVLMRDVASSPGSTQSATFSLGKIVISLAIVILLVIGLGWMFKKLSLRMPGNKQIKVICALPLGQRERILVIEIQGKQRVIGVTPQNINLLFELENPLPEEKLASDFHTQLQSFLKK